MSLALLALLLHTTVPARAIVICAGEDGTRNVEFAHSPGECAHTSDHVDLAHEGHDHDDPSHHHDAASHLPDDANCHEGCSALDHDHGCDDDVLALTCLLTSTLDTELCPQRWVSDLAVTWWPSAVAAGVHAAAAGAGSAPSPPPYHTRTVVMTC